MLLGTKRSLLHAALVLSGSFVLRGGLLLFTVSRVIAGSAGLIKYGPSTVNLSAVNTFTGNIVVNAGTLAFTGAGSLGAGTFSGGILNNGSLNSFSSANQTLSGIISGGGGISMAGSGTLTLSNASNSYSGPVSITAGTLVANSNGVTGTGSITIDGGTLKMTATGYTLGAARTITIGASGGTINNTTGTFNKAINLSSNGQLLGSGTLTISGGTNQTDVVSVRAYQSLFSGAINIVSGRLEVSTADTGTGGNYLLGTGPITISSPGSLALGADITAGAWANTFSNAVTVGGGGDGTGAIHSKSTANTTFTNTVTLAAATTIGNDAAGPGFIVFSGVVSGAFTLTANAPVEFDAINTFTGLTLGSGRTLRGTGTIPTVSIPNAANSVLQPGTGSGTVGTLTINGNLTFAGSTAALAISSNGASSTSVAVSGTCALGACKVNLLNTMAAGTYNLIVASGTMSGTLPTIGTNSSGRTPTLAQVGNTLTLTLV